MLSIREAFKGNGDWVIGKWEFKDLSGRVHPNLYHQFPELKNPPSPIADTQKIVPQSGLIGLVGAGL
ncbi:hypothetical protein QUB19_28460 [Microcoleus sp. B4-C5]|uniref:hypothetical protein n=1 Tax=unclassified Microcoleus TaxID=2642155 RepID=UPI002FD2DE0E